MRVVLVSGIFPPDIGGPATHSDDLRHELRERGHDVTVLTLWDGPCVSTRPGLVRIPRRWTWPIRQAAVASWLVLHRDRYDAVYATGLHPAAVAGARIAERPVVVKVVGDPVWERGQRLGLTASGFEEFQGAPVAAGRLGAMRKLRDWSLRHATAITVPSEYLAGVVEGWLGGPSDVTVIPNGVRMEPTTIAHIVGPSFRAIFVGRLVAHKRVDRLIEATAAAPGTSLDVIGDGPERTSLETLVTRLGIADRVQIHGELPHVQMLRRIASADALVLASDYEGLPHVVIEAMVAGTPVIAPSVGGVVEVVEDGRSGLILPQAEVDTLAAAFVRLRDDAPLLTRLREGAREAGRSWTMSSTADGVEVLMERARRGRPRFVLLGKARWPDLVPEHEREKLRLLVANTQPTMIRTGRAGIRHLGRARAVLLPAEGRAASPVFYAVGPMIAVGLAAARRGAAVICQSGYEGFGVALLCRLLPRTWRPQFVVEVHGDWRTAVNGYGDDDGLRSRLGPVADAAARWALREADVVRAVSAYTERLARDAGVAGRVERFATFEDAASLLVTPPAPMPDEPRAVYVGSLEPVKGVDVLLEAWGEVRRRVPEAVLVMAGDGSRRAAFGRDAKALGIEMRGNVPHDLVAGVLDDARFLIVPSRSEGLGRVILEAFARGRPVVGTSVGGIPEMVRGGRTGILVPPEDALALADAIVRAFEDPAATAAMGVRARATAESRDPDETFEAGFARLAAWVGGR